MDCHSEILGPIVIVGISHCKVLPITVLTIDIIIIGKSLLFDLWCLCIISCIGGEISIKIINRTDDDDDDDSILYLTFAAAAAKITSEDRRTYTSGHRKMEVEERGGWKGNSSGNLDASRLRGQWPVRTTPSGT